MRLGVLIIFLICSTVTANELDYYRLHFEKKKPHKLADTLFEKTVWRRKVSHLVLEERNEQYLVTLLMISPYPYNYKSTNYPIRYHFKTMAEALQKYQFMHRFLSNNGVMRVKILGSRITKETILYPGGADN